MQKQIPNLFTLLNLVFGCIAIVFILQTNSFNITGADGELPTVSLPENIVLGSIFIFIAAIIDFMDGFVARLFKASSAMGKQLDSLADVVSFGVAPSMILYQLLRMSLIKEETGLQTSIAWLLPAFVMACAGAWRLARFNLDESQSYGFKGLPIPAAGLLVASFPLILYYGNKIIDVNEWLTNKWFLYGMIFLLSWLMVSTLPLMALKFRDLSLKNNFPKIILLIITGFSAFLFHWMAVPVIFIVYIILSLVFKQQPS